MRHLFMAPNRRTLALLAVSLSLVAGRGPALRDIAAAEPVYPAAEWQSRAPEELGLDAERLEAFSRSIGGRGCVVRHGYLAYTWGDATRRGDVASAVKPVYSHFLLEALERGKIPDLDGAVVKYEPALARLNADLGFPDRQITWRHLANQVSCYGVQEGPGEAFDYSDWQMALFFDLLFGKVYGATLDEVDSQVLRPLLTDRIGCQDRPTFLAFGKGNRPGRLAISPRDFARFGLLYLRGGKWRDEQLISPESVALATTSALPNTIPRTRGEKAAMLPDQRSIGGGNNQTDHRGSYSFAWWTNGITREGKRNLPDAPHDTFGCYGHGGPRVMVVFPSLDLIVSWNDARVEGWEEKNAAIAQLLAAVGKSPVAVQSQPQSALRLDPQRPRWLYERDGTPFFFCGPGDPEGFLYRGELRDDGTRDGDQLAIIDKLTRTGANCIYLMAFRSHGGDGDRTHNPFVDHDPERGLNEKVLDQWDGWFEELDAAGVVIYFFLYDDSCRVWKSGDAVGDAERRFVRALVDRFEARRHLVWCIAEEYAERLSAPRVSALARVIRSADDGAHPIAVHKNDGLNFDEFADDPNIDQFAIQYNRPTAGELHGGVVEAWKRAAGRYSLNLSEAKDMLAGADRRRKAWACAMAGASVMVLDMDVATTPIEDLRDCGRLARFFRDHLRADMAPRDELAAGTTSYVLAAPPDRYIVYALEPSGPLGLKELAGGRYDLEWFDCRSGDALVRRRVRVAAGEARWEVPGRLGDEVALVVTRR